MKFDAELLDAQAALDAEIAAQFSQAPQPADTIPATQEPAQEPQGDGLDPSFYVGGADPEPVEPTPPAADPEPMAPAAPPSASVSVTPDDLIRMAKELAREQVQPHIPAAPAPKAPEPLFNPSDLELNATEQEAWSQHQSTIDKIVKKALNEYHDKIRPTIEQTQEELRKTQMQSAMSDEAAFQMRVETAVPNFKDIISDKRWQTYLDSPVYGSGGGITLKNMLAQNLNSRNIQGVLEIFKGFQPPVAPTAQAVAPSRGSATTPPRTPVMADKKLAYSKLEIASERARTDHQFASSPEWAKIQSVYSTAAVDDMIDYNA